MESELKSVASAIAQADLDRLPVKIRDAYEAGATVDQVRAAVGVGCCMGEVPFAVRARALALADAWAWVARHKHAA